MSSHTISPRQWAKLRSKQRVIINGSPRCVADDAMFRKTAENKLLDEEESVLLLRKHDGSAKKNKKKGLFRSDSGSNESSEERRKSKQGHVAGNSPVLTSALRESPRYSPHQQRRKHVDDTISTTSNSVQFAYNDDDDAPPPPPPPPPPRSCEEEESLAFSLKSSIMLEDDCDDDTITVQSKTDESTLIKLSSRMNDITDDKLMDDHNSPGVLRLTEEGLKRHEHKSFQKYKNKTSSNNSNEKPTREAAVGDGYLAWKQHKDKKQLQRAKLEQHRKQHSEKVLTKELPKKLVIQHDNDGQRPRLSSEHKQVSFASTITSASSKQSKGSSKKSKKKKKNNNKDDFEHWNDKINKGHPPPPPHSSPRRSPLGLFSKKFKKSQSAQELLDMDRQRQHAARMERKKETESQERLRIQRLRNAELKRQRQREADARNGIVVQPILPLFLNPEDEDDDELMFSVEMEESSGIFGVGMEVMDKKVTAGVPDRIIKGNNYQGGGDISTMSTSVSSASLMCVVCTKEERSQIAMPCMHFSFCQTCVEKLRQDKVSECPVCHKPNVSYSPVYC